VEGQLGLTPVLSFNHSMLNHIPERFTKPKSLQSTTNLVDANMTVKYDKPNKRNVNTYLSAKWKGTEISFIKPLGSRKTQEKCGLLPPSKGMLLRPIIP
jgi:hypothetical protein